MDNIIRYILIGAGIFLAVSIFSRLFVFYWRAGYDERKKKREQKRIEKQKWKYAHIQNGNPLLENITTTRFIIIEGDKGSGKTLIMNLVSHYLYDKQADFNKKHKRYNRVMNSDYAKEYNNLKEQNKLPIYSNLEFVEKDKKGIKKSQDLIPYLTLRKKAIYHPIFIIDEFSSLFPKEMYYENQANPDPVVAEMKELFKKDRHYLNGWILGTEQDGEDMFKGFRQNGYARVKSLRTIVSLDKKGKFVRGFKNFWNAILPAFLTLNMFKIRKKELFIKDKILSFFKALLPAYIFYPREYYLKKQELSNKINDKYQRYLVHLIFNGVEYYVRFTNDDIFQYDTHAYKHEYDEKFDKNGNRKETNFGGQEW